MLSDEWLSRYGLLENFNASVTRTRKRTRTGTRTGTGTGTGTWTTEVTAIALCTSCSRAKNVSQAPPHLSETPRITPFYRLKKKKINKIAHRNQHSDP